jgi:CDP-diacylglycerol--glycerol-3-phosphate 3-phosphatidyltransferase
MATVTPPRPALFNLPNQLTASRLVLAVVLFILIACEQWLGCLGVFALAALTDWLDGYFARKQGLVSALGRSFDPLVDKVLICGAYIFLLPFGTKEGWLTPWMVTVVVARELIITGLRSFMENQGANFGADVLGKYKMVLQCAALIAVFLSLELNRIAVTLWTEHSMLIIVYGIELTQWTEYTILIRNVLIYLMLFITALSGLQYCWRAWRLYQCDD